ncbi:KpsF/GutQ family sugar-phosphate isomerase [Octadecabacter sp.]|nr:KpsF/GutQ family sugar-phosphate isomerase [Octadecabacter sp.]
MFGTFMNPTNDPRASVNAALACFDEGMKQLQREVNEPELSAIVIQAANTIFDMKGRLIISGIGKSGHIARKLAATFSSTGTSAYFVHATEASHGDLGMIQNDDVLLLISWSGQTKELSDIVAYGLRFGIQIIAMTCGANSSLAKNADIPIVLPKVEEACPHNLAPTTSTMLQLAMGDALAVTVLKMRGFSEENFRGFHPGGKLGASLQPISEFMHKEARLPLISIDAPVLEVISEISVKGFGIVGLLDREENLCGIITDGDIRRYLKSNAASTLQLVLEETSVADMMTEGGIRLSPDVLAAKALNTLQTNRISAAFVVEGNRPVGLVSLLQLLQQGVS